MKSTAPLLVLLLLCAAAVVLVEKRHVSARISPAPVLHMVGDSERDLTTLPIAAARLSDAEEIRIGDTLAGEVLPPGSPPLTPRQRAWQKLVRHIGQRLTAHAHRHLPWHFHLLPDRDYINAFALPGGQIFVGQGLLHLLKTRDELATVLGHEIEHVDHRHCAERVELQARARQLHLDAAADVLQIPLGVLEAGYSQQQELQADREGVRLAVASGYSPAGALHLFRQFAALDPYHPHPAGSPVTELSRAAAATLADYFRTHPPIDERIRQIQALIASEHWNANAPETPLPPLPPAAKKSH